MRPDPSAMFLYNLVLRFSSHLEGVDQRGYHPYGAIPFMLYGLLYRVCFIRPASSNEKDHTLAICSLEPATIIRHMNALNDVARAELLEPASLKPTDVALLSARTAASERSAAWPERLLWARTAKAECHYEVPCGLPRAKAS